MKKEMETNKENYVKELQKLIQIKKNRFLNIQKRKLLANTQILFKSNNRLILEY